MNPTQTKRGSMFSSARMFAIALNFILLAKSISISKAFIQHRNPVKTEKYILKRLSATNHPLNQVPTENRRSILLSSIFTAVSAAGSLLSGAPAVNALGGSDKIPDTLDVENFLRYGQVSNPMGVSGQAGKSRPETGVVLR